MRLNLIPVLAALLLSGCAPVQTTVNPAVLPAATDFGTHENPMEWWYVSSYLPGEGLALHWAQFRVRDPRVPFPVFISHVAVTDLRSGQVTFLEQSPDTGEVAFPPLRIRQGAWTLTQAGPQPTAPMTLKAGPLDLTLTPVKGPVLHPPGFSGSADTGVLFYQGITRLTLTGSVNGRAVQGEAWLDHQWGNQIPGQTALWDWFSVQLDGGRDLMVYRVRRLDGTVAQLIGWPDPKAWTLSSRDSIQERAYTVIFPFSPGGRDDGRMCGVLPAHGDGRPATGLPGPLIRRPVAQRRMRPPSVVKRAPGLQNHLSMQHRVEHFQVQAFLPES
ncbi:lipocalin-like domain-containing protein [Deinococcus sp. 14RED07]|uniref:lipocalin-like domain-containing protein n=1 Tax=Deinococcus sp. 14RED07 TaxID=2745874 RepID=UPI001E497C14|nr:lipocalin-like domain-containing protein [Deinococcus sp. 14RED07]